MAKQDIPIRDTNTSRETHPGRKSLILLAICTGYFMVILDTTVVNVALLSIQHQFGTTIAEQQWIVDGYNLMLASLLLTAGAIGDRLGNRRLFLIGLALFILASALCGLAPTLWTLQAARVLQGIGAALLVPSSLSLLSHSFPDSAERARMIGIWGGIAGIAAGAGPVLGGLLVNTLGWRSIFLVNIPVGLAGLLLTLRFVPLTPCLRQRGLNLSAQLSGILALGSLTFACIEGPQLGWTTPLILGALVTFILAAAAFLWVEKHSPHPMLPLQLFTIPAFSAANTVGLLLNFGFYGQLFFINFFFQQIQGYSPLLAGLALLPETGMALLASSLSGRVTGHFGPRFPMVAGLALGGLGFLAMILVNGQTTYLVICFMLVAIGFGTAFTMPAMTTVVIEHAPRERSGIAAAVLNASRQVGSVLGVALLGSLIGKHATFITGMHFALVLASCAFLIAYLLSLFTIKEKAVAPGS